MGARAGAGVADSSLRDARLKRKSGDAAMSAEADLAVCMQPPGQSLDAALEGLVELRRGLPLVTYRERVAALDALGEALVGRRAALPAELRNAGVAFLAGFLRASQLEALLRRELP